MKEEKSKPITLKISLPATRGETPALAVHLLDADGAALACEPVSAGRAALDAATLERAAQVVVTRADAPLERVSRKARISLMPRDVQRLAATGRALNVTRQSLVTLFPWVRCLEGTVEACRWEWLFGALAQRFTPAAVPIQPIKAFKALPSGISLGPIAPPQIVFPGPFKRCDPVCDGEVEVYRRTCCVHPIPLPPLPELIPWPPEPIPIPLPDPPPWFDEAGLARLREDLRLRVGEVDGALSRRLDADTLRRGEAPLVRSGALATGAIEVKADLHAIESLGGDQLHQYLIARPYLWWPWTICSQPVKVGQGFLDPTGSFRICVVEPWLLQPLCRYEYAFRVTQIIDGLEVVIYDGLAAGAWFSGGGPFDLESFHPDAVACPEPPDLPEGAEGATIFLQDIGYTHAYDLDTPASAAWNATAAAGGDEGVAFPSGVSWNASRSTTDANWGGDLRLLYHFSEATKGTGARYYRLRVTPTDATGQPTGGSTVLSDAVSWRYLAISGGSLFIESEALGPNTVGGETNLFKIPYRADREWLSNQFHQTLRSGRFTQGRYLLTLEVFDAGGGRLRPLAVPVGEAGLGAAAGFTFTRWSDPDTSVALVGVPYAALTHMLWWDNREPVAQIRDLRVGGNPNTSDCQFLSGGEDAMFSVGYAAYHPEPLFLRNYRMYTVKGLNGSSITYDTGSANSPGAPATHEGPQETFRSMLGAGDDQCAFSVGLNVYAKTWDGVGHPGHYDAHDVAALAMLITP